MARPPMDEHGGRRSRIMFRLEEFVGLRSVDVQFLFVNQAGEWSRTRKGITLNHDRYRVLRAAFERHDEEIMTWVADDSVPEAITRLQEAMVATAEREKYSSTRVELAWYEDGRDPHFFMVTHAGGTTRVAFNKSDLFAALMQETPDIVPTLLATVVAASDKARNVIEGARAFDRRTRFGHVEADWGNFLGQHSGDSDG